MITRVLLDSYKAERSVLQRVSKWVVFLLIIIFAVDSYETHAQAENMKRKM